MHLTKASILLSLAEEKRSKPDETPEQSAMGDRGALSDPLCTRGTAPVPRSLHQCANESEEEEERDGKDGDK